jgi:hypothetical protein
MSQQLKIKHDHFLYGKTCNTLLALSQNKNGTSRCTHSIGMAKLA